MKKEKIYSRENVPKSNIILATKSTLKETKAVRDTLHPHLNLLIVKNDMSNYELRFVYKLLMRIQK